MRFGGFVACAVLISVLVAPALAHDHRPPQATLLTDDERQRGQSYHADWTRRDRTDSRFCIASFGHGFPTFGRAVRHSTGQPVVVRLHKKAPPLEVEVQRWRDVNDDGQAKGQSRPLPWLLRPHRVDGQIRAWDVVIGWPASVDHLYLGVGAYWADEEGCSAFPDLGNQYAAWTFHAKNH